MQISNRPVTFGTSDSERRVTIQTNADNLVEGDEMFTVTLAPISDRVIITEDSADITIEETANGTLLCLLVYYVILFFSEQFWWRSSQIHTLYVKTMEL